MILANGCNITKSEKCKGVWILSVPTVYVSLPSLFIVRQLSLSSINTGMFWEQMTLEIVSYYRGRNIRDHLVNTFIKENKYVTLDHSTGFYPCKICSACENAIKMDSFNSTTTQKTLKMVNMWPKRLPCFYSVNCLFFWLFDVWVCAVFL